MGKIKRFFSQFTIYKIVTALACAWAPYAHGSFYVQVDSGQATVSGVIAGSIGVEKIGAGSAILLAINTYTEPTVVSAGELLINGSIPGDVTVDIGTTLGGAGTIGGSVDNIAGSLGVAGGTVRTGDIVGSHLTIQGDYTQGAFATLLIKASLTASDCLVVGGNAILDGILEVFLQTGM